MLLHRLPKALVSEKKSTILFLHVICCLLCLLSRFFLYLSVHSLIMIYSDVWMWCSLYLLWVSFTEL